jgi:hypothetical protein
MNLLGLVLVALVLCDPGVTPGQDGKGPPARGDDERREFPPEHQRPPSLRPRHLKLEQEPCPLFPARPSQVLRRYVQRRDRREITVLHVRYHRIEHRVAEAEEAGTLLGDFPVDRRPVHLRR